MTTNTTVAGKETSLDVRGAITAAATKAAAAGATPTETTGGRGVRIAGGTETSMTTTAGGVIPRVLGTVVVGKTGAHPHRRDPEEQNGKEVLF